MLKKYLEKIRRSWKGRGFIKSIIFVVNKIFINLRFHPYDFKGTIEPKDLDGPEEVKRHATKYEASNQKFFMQLFDKLDWPYQESTFIDFGCGKGATLYYALKLGFGKVIGVEYSASLVNIALKNLQKNRRKRSNLCNCEIVEADASQYEVPDDADCFYFFNPFDAFILDQVMQNIQKSLAKKPRNVIIIYLNALHSQTIEKYPFKVVKFISVRDLDIYYHGGAYVYKNY